MQNTSNDNPRWLNWTTRLQALAQTGLTFARDPYDIERYQALREIAAEMLAAGAGADITVIRDLLTADAGYATPKTDVRGIVFQDDKILLVREKSDGRWTPPGGWADVGASPAENVEREVREEAGLKTRARKILAVFDRSRHPHTPPFPFHIYKIFMLCELLGPADGARHSAAAQKEGSNLEIEGIDFFAETDLPDLSLTRVTTWQIHRMFEHHRNPDLPTDFDVAP
jgi:ADP-ribose pyrophosphatase YjhB (NUDIX family)